MVEEVLIRGIRTRLSPEQMEVMALLAEGWTYREVGTALNLSYWGVRQRVYSVCDAIGARNRVEALILLTREGVLA